MSKKYILLVVVLLAAAVSLVIYYQSVLDKEFETAINSHFKWSYSKLDLPKPCLLSEAELHEAFVYELADPYWIEDTAKPLVTLCIPIQYMPGTGRFIGFNCEIKFLQTDGEQSLIKQVTYEGIGLYNRAMHDSLARQFIDAENDVGELYYPTLTNFVPEPLTYYDTLRIIYDLGSDSAAGYELLREQEGDYTIASLITGVYQRNGGWCRAR